MKVNSANSLLYPQLYAILECDYIGLVVTPKHVPETGIRAGVTGIRTEATKGWCGICLGTVWNIKKQSRKKLSEVRTYMEKIDRTEVDELKKVKQATSLQTSASPVLQTIIFHTVYFRENTSEVRNTVRNHSNSFLPILLKRQVNHCSDQCWLNWKMV